MTAECPGVQISSLQGRNASSASLQMYGDALDTKFALMEGSTVDDDLLKLKTDLLNIDNNVAKLPAQTQAWESIPNFQRKPNSVDIVWP